jgi:hypothetical protein
MKTIAFYSTDPNAGGSSLVTGLAGEAARLGPGYVMVLSCGAVPAPGKDSQVMVRHCQSSDMANALATLPDEGLDLALVDVPATVDSDVATILRAADLVVLPVHPDPDRLDSVARTIEMVERETKPYLFVLNMAEPEGEDTMATAVALAGYGTICPVIVPNSSAQDPDSPVFADVFQYLLGRLDKASGKEGEPSRPAPAPSADERRAFPRWECTLPGRMVVGDIKIPCKITDISGGGMSVECDVPLAVGAKAIVETPSLGPIEAEVRYSGNRRLGLMFTMDTAQQTDLIILMANTIERARKSA